MRLTEEIINCVLLNTEVVLQNEKLIKFWIPVFAVHFLHLRVLFMNNCNLETTWPIKNGRRNQMEQYSWNMGRAKYLNN